MPKKNKELLDACFILILPAMCLSSWLVVLYLAKPIDFNPEEQRKLEAASATKTSYHFDSCSRMEKSEATGQLCIDLCVEKTLKLPEKSYLIDRYYLSRVYDALSRHTFLYSIVCAPNHPPSIDRPIDMAEFELILIEKIRAFVHNFYGLDKKLK